MEREILNAIRASKTKRDARDVAMYWQTWQSNADLSQSDYDFWWTEFYALGRKHGLVREFKENGIL